MALRISKKERASLYAQNARARKKQERLHSLYGKRITFETRTPSSFKTRAELNKYKEELRYFNAPYTHRYVSGGVQTVRTTGSQEQFNLAIPYRVAQEIRQREKRWNKYVAKNYKNLAYTPYHIKGKEQDMLTVHHINPWYPETNIPYKTLKEVQTKYHAYFTARADFSSFHTTRDINKYLDKLRYFMNPEHANKQLAQSKENYIKSLTNTYGTNAFPLADVLKELTASEWGNLYDTERFIDFDLQYSADYNDRDLKAITQGLLGFIYRNPKINERIGDKLKDLTDTLKLSNIDIVSEMNTNIIEYTHNGMRYRVGLRYSEIKDFYKYGATQQILERSEYLGKEIPTQAHEKKSHRKR